MLTVHHFLAGFAVLTVWVLSLYVHPFGKCPRCRGRRVVMRSSSGKRRRRPKRCWLCKGAGRRQRPGSKTVHRTIRRIRRELHRQRTARQHTASEEPANARLP
jgi:hypothetical protein